MSDKEKVSGHTDEVIKDNDYYYNIVNPQTGMRFDIPLLSPLSPKYYYEYIYFMKIRETSPDTFERILRWD